jgi:cysteine synthase
MNREEQYLSEYEAPRFAKLRPNLHAACFPLMKLLPARFILDRAQSSGQLSAGGHIAETTSGTFGLALALLAAVRGYELTLVTASSLIDDAFRRRLELLGAAVRATADHKGTGDQEARLAELRGILEDRPETFWPRQYDNPQNALAYGRLAERIVRVVGRVDCLVGCVGSGGSLCGTGGFLRTLFPGLRLVAVDTNRSVLFGHPAGPRLLRGLGNSIVPANLKHEAIDEVHWVGALPAFSAARAHYREHAIFMGPTSGAAALVAGWHAGRDPGASCVVILPDEGHRYQDTLYDDAWLEALEGWPVCAPTTPVQLTRVQPGGECDWTYVEWRRRELRDAPGAGDVP